MFDDLDREPAMNSTPAPELDGLLRSCCRAAGLDGAGVSIVDRDGTREPLYASDEVATVIERLQLTLGEGPCVDSSWTGSPVLVADLTDPRDVAASAGRSSGMRRRGPALGRSSPSRSGSVRYGWEPSTSTVDHRAR